MSCDFAIGVDPSKRRIGLVGCVKLKQDSARPAQDLYTSPLFRYRRAYAERSCTELWILSALHGLLDPTLVIEPYDLSLTKASSLHRKLWSKAVLGLIVERVRPEVGDCFEIHAGNDYRAWGLVQGLVALGCRVEVPTEGMTQGRQLSFYANSR